MLRMNTLQMHSFEFEGQEIIIARQFEIPTAHHAATCIAEGGVVKPVVTPRDDRRPHIEPRGFSPSKEKMRV